MPIDTTGQYQQRSGETIKYSNAKELASFLARSEETHRSFVRQLFHHMVQQPILAYGSESIGDLSRFFRDHQVHMKHLMVEIACRSALQTNSGADQPAVATSSNPKQ